MAPFLVHCNDLDRFARFPTAVACAKIISSLSNPCAIFILDLHSGILGGHMADIQPFIDKLFLERSELSEDTARLTPIERAMLKAQLTSETWDVINHALARALPLAKVDEAQKLIKNGTADEVQHLFAKNIPKCDKLIAKTLLDFREHYLRTRCEVTPAKAKQSPKMPAWTYRITSEWKMRIAIMMGIMNILKWLLVIASIVVIFLWKDYRVTAWWVTGIYLVLKIAARAFLKKAVY